MKMRTAVGRDRSSDHVYSSEPRSRVSSSGFSPSQLSVDQCSAMCIAFMAYSSFTAL